MDGDDIIRPPSMEKVVFHFLNDTPETMNHGVDGMDDDNIIDDDDMYYDMEMGMLL